MSEQHEYDGIKYREEQRSPLVFRVLFAALALWAIPYAGHYLFSGWSSQAEVAAREARKTGTATAGAAATPEDAIARGKQLFAADCAACHGESAKGGFGPDLTAPAYKYGKSKADIARTINEGRPKGMPGFSSKYDAGRVDALVEYLLSLK
jgi:cytochrome c oxidase cbb3-type subunit 3